MASPLETIARMKNIRFFSLLEKETTVRAAAKRAGITPQHGTRLVRLWRQAGWIQRAEGEGSPYIFTEEGEKLLVIGELMKTVKSDEKR